MASTGNSINSTNLDKGSTVFNVKAYGAVGNDSTDDTTAIQAAIAAAGAVGGTVWFPPATYKITTSLKLYNAAPTPDVPYSNIKILGAGSSGTLGSIIKQYTTSEDVIQGLNNVTNTVQLLNVSFQDICLTFGGTATNSGNGIYLKQVAAGGPSFQGMYLENVVVSNCNATGKYGFNFESMITSSVVNCMAVTCANGFYLNGAVGGAFNSVSTSVSFINCYANGCTVNGYKCLNNTYISYLGCAADFASGAGIGYLVDDSNCVSLTGCGSELSGTFTGTLFKINAAFQIGFYNCYAFQNDNVAMQVTGSSTGITIVGFQNNSDTSTATTGLLVDAGSSVTEVGNDWGGADTPRSINATAVDFRVESPATGVPAVVVNGSVGVDTGTYTPTLTSVANVGASTAYACQYMRVGGTVTVSGKVDVDPTTGVSTTTQLGMSLPLASDFTTAQQCAGTGCSPSIATQSGGVYGDTTNNRAQLDFKAVDPNNASWYFTFTYTLV